MSIDWQQAIKGLVLLAAVAFDVWNKRRTAGSGGAGAEAAEPSAPPPDKLAEEIEAMEAELSVDSNDPPKT